MNKNLRLFILILNDIFLILLSICLALIIRSLKFPTFDAWSQPLFIAVILYLGLFFTFKIDQEYFKYFNFQSLKKYFYVAILYSSIFIFLLFFFKFYATPRSLGILQPPIFFTLLIISRYLAKEFLKSSQITSHQESLIILGNSTSFHRILSDQGEYFSSYILINPTDPSSRSFQGKKIYSLSQFKQLTNTIPKALFVLDQTFLKDLDRKIIIELLEKNYRFLSFNLEEDKIRYQSLDYHDYLFPQLDFSLNDNFYENKTVLITGAGGSVGTALTFELLKIKKIKLILVDYSEYNIFKLQQLIKDQNNYQIFLLNVLDKEKMENLVKSETIDIVIHAAAYKHVNILQRQEYEAIENNYLTTKILCDSSINHKVKNFLFISTDKAVRPTSIMGISKRIAEIYLQNKIQQTHDTQISIVRFGNVLDSSGSALPIFLDQIQKKQPVTVTNRKVERYFMSISQAAKLALESNSFNKSGIYHLDMGESFNIWNLAEKLIKIHGYHPTDNDKNFSNNHILIREIGLFDGEKLFEELLIDGEHKPTSNHSILESIEVIQKDEFKEIIYLADDFLLNQNIDFFSKIKKKPAINYQA